MESSKAAEMRCLGDDTVLRFVQRKLTKEAALHVDQHMAECEACRTLVAETAKYVLPNLGGSESTTETDLLRRIDAGLVKQPPIETSFSRVAFVGRYEVKELLGAGAMGVVFRAHDPHLRRNVALKLLRPDQAGKEGRAQSRLLREARAMARLSHPNVVAVYDAGSFEGGVFIAMELLESTLKGRLAQRPHSWREVLELFEAAGRGLAAAHSVGIVHRDFKPENVLVGADGRVRVTDFGLARPAEGSPTSSKPQILERARAITAPLGSAELNAICETIPERTRTGALVGTPAYMAPEQFACIEIDARTDQFSFAVALYEALYKRRPYDASSLVELAGEVLSGRVLPPPDNGAIPEGIGGALVRSLAVDPAARHASMDALLDALAEAEAPRSGRRATSTARASSAPAPSSLRRGVRSALLLGVALTAAIGVAAYARTNRGRLADALRSGAEAPPAESDRALQASAPAVSPPIAEETAKPEATAIPTASTAALDPPASSASTRVARAGAPRPRADAVRPAAAAPAASSKPAARDDDAPIADPWKK